jgi:hypothetical protein
MSDVRDRWAEITIFDKPPMPPRLRGLPIEYAILQVYSRDAGQRSASLKFDVGQGTADIGFRNDVEICLMRVRRIRQAPVARRAGKARNRGVPGQRRSGSRLSEPVEEAGTRPSVSGPGLSFRWRHDRVFQTVGSRWRCRADRVVRRRNTRIQCLDGPTEIAFVSAALDRYRRPAGGTPAIITSTPPAARTMTTRPKESSRGTCGRK